MMGDCGDAGKVRVEPIVVLDVEEADMVYPLVLERRGRIIAANVSPTYIAMHHSGIASKARQGVVDVDVL
jgi:hypothetical protein